MITCANPKCGRENEDHYKYCLGCGSPLAAKPAPAAEVATATNCTQCGSPLSPGQRFCVSCGFSVASITVNAGSSAAPAAVTKDSASTPAPAPASAEAIAPPEEAVLAPAPATAGNPTAAAPEPQAPAPEPQAAVAPEPGPSAVAAPATAPSASNEVGRLVMINPDRSIGGIISLATGETVVGRATGHNIFTHDEFVSPTHAGFRVNGTSIHVRDLNSLNGIYYRITEVTELQSGDTFRIGKNVFTFETTENLRKVAADNADGSAIDGGRPTLVWGRLARVSGPEGYDAASNAWLLYQEDIVVGRERGDIVLRDDSYASGTHARIVRTSDGRVFLEDLQSSNGTYLRIRQEATLPNGSYLMVGEQPLRVQLADV